MVINPIVGVYIPIIRIPLNGGMTIPNIATFDHGTNGGLNGSFFITMVQSVKKPPNTQQIQEKGGGFWHELPWLPKISDACW